MSKEKLIVQNELVKAIDEMDFFYYQLCNTKGKRNGKTKALVDYERAARRRKLYKIYWRFLIMNKFNEELKVSKEQPNLIEQLVRAVEEVYIKQGKNLTKEDEQKLRIALETFNKRYDLEEMKRVEEEDMGYRRDNTNGR